MRSRIIAVVKSMAFFLTEKTFYKTLISLHKKHVTGEKVATCFKYLRETIWPNGEWMEPAEELTEQEKKENYLQVSELTTDIIATSTLKLTHPILLTRFIRFARPSHYK